MCGGFEELIAHAGVFGAVENVFNAVSQRCGFGIKINEEVEQIAYLFFQRIGIGKGAGEFLKARDHIRQGFGLVRFFLLNVLQLFLRLFELLFIAGGFQTRDVLIQLFFLGSERFQVFDSVCNGLLITFAAFFEVVVFLCCGGVGCNFALVGKGLLDLKLL